MRRVTAHQGSLFGGHDRVRVRANGREKVVVSVADGPKQLTIDGRAEPAHTKRNEANLEREAEDLKNGRTAK